MLEQFIADVSICFISYYSITVFKGKINCCSIMDIAGIHVPTGQIMEFSSFSLSSALRHTPSATFVIAENEMCRIQAIWAKTFSRLRPLFSVRESI
jgi:hypothetical protein